MIMLRESTGQVRARKDDCDCGILGEVVDGLDGVLNQDKDEETVVEEGEFVNMMAGALVRRLHTFKTQGYNVQSI